MISNTFTNRIKTYVDDEIKKAAVFIKSGDFASAFQHLERAHVIGQAVTV